MSLYLMGAQTSNRARDVKFRDNLRELYYWFQVSANGECSLVHGEIVISVYNL